MSLSSSGIMVDEHLISLQPGTVIAGRYEVVKCLGQGSMGLVYACRHKELSGHLVAVKVLFPEVARDKIAAARFRNEIFASYGVSHPNVVRAYEYLRDGDLVAYTMEYIGGGDLADRLGNPDETLPIAEIVRLLGQMCSGVQAIHDTGIVHRDLKPENILLTKDGVVKIADFGIARTRDGPKLTEHGGVVGTIDYVSPEYMLNSQVDWRSDIYALGILGYEMITGESPFRGDSVYATMTKRLKTDPAAPSTLRKECPPELDRIVLKAMERDPEKRYQSAAEIFYDLQELSSDRQVNSGAYLQVSRPASRAYVGPSLHAGSAGAGAEGAGVEVSATQELPVMRTVTESPPPRQVQRADSRPPLTAGTPSRPPPRSTEQAGSRGAAKPPAALTSVPSQDLDSTEILNHEIVEIASHYQDGNASGEPVKMERMLTYKDLVLSGWEESPVPSEVNISRSGIDENRIRKLSELVDSVNQSWWMDVVLWIVAAVIAVGVSFSLLMFFAPELIDGKPATQDVVSGK